ncbi:hypothetical protein [Carnobacterium sp. FSL W8-0810]|uniref:hypothetical protein n=1 Tax=Carnobacterium sp. FSL W8-0810 TaxID=2954705 RepID=UPI0030FA5C91
MLTKIQILIGLVGIIVVAYLTLNEVVSPKIGGILWTIINSLILIFHISDFRERHFKK